MNPPKCHDDDYINFLIAAQRRFTCTEAARSQPDGDDAPVTIPPAHDSFTRFLQRLPSNTEALWNESRRLIDPTTGGILIVDDSTLDKPYANKMDYVTYHWSGKHHRVVKGINLITTLWSNGTALIPCDFRLYNASVDHLTKNDHFQNMLVKAKMEREKCNRATFYSFDSWYSGLENLKIVARKLGWHFFCRLKENRLVNPDKTWNKPIKEVEIPPEGRIVHLNGFGMIKVFKTVSTKGDVEYWATDNPEMKEAKGEELSDMAWGIEEYHRGIKQCCGVERAQVRNAAAIANHILLSIRAFIRLELYRLETGTSWYEAKIAIIRDAVTNYLMHPIYILGSTA
ncbi:MAG: IS701 family transposase [Rhabdochlamydiaceae bacterium]